MIDRELYLPLRWIQDPERCREAGIPEEVAFQTKGEQAQQMIERLWKAGIPFAWVVAGIGLRGQWSAAGVSGSTPVLLRIGGGLRFILRNIKDTTEKRLRGA